MKAFLCLVCSCLLVLAAPPKIVRTVPANGTDNVDPQLGKLRIEFDQPMDRGGWSIVGDGPTFPKLVGSPWWDDDRVFVCRWALAPGQVYSFRINSGSLADFRNPDGEPAEPYPILFKTGGEAIEPTDSPTPSEVFRTDLLAFFAEVDRAYPFFELKDIRADWEHTKEALRGRVSDCGSPTEFLSLVLEAMRCLRDAHLQLNDPQAPLPVRPTLYCPGVAFMPATEGRVVIMAVAEGLPETLRPGTLVTHIDGRNAREVLEECGRTSWSAANPFFVSSRQRARLFSYRLALMGTEGTRHVLRIEDSQTAQEITIVCDRRVGGWPHTYNLPSGLVRSGRSVLFGRLTSGVGYVYLRRVDTSTEPGLGQALETFGDAAGWIVDLRGNSGGGYDNTLVDRVKSMPRPVVVLIDAGCISAGETLARDFRRYADAHLMGSRTAGSSSSKRRWTFPSGVATVTFSARSRWRADGQPIEYLGIEPDTVVEAEPEEVARGLNSEILRGEAFLRGRHGE